VSGNEFFEGEMNTKSDDCRGLAREITRASSKQTCYTIRLFADRRFAEDAYRAYAYFRWVDDILDEGPGNRIEKSAFIDRQYKLMEDCYRGETPAVLCKEERMLADLVRNDHDEKSGLRSYLINMMAVMSFDAARRGRIISHVELQTYTKNLATAVTEAMHYFIGHDDPTPHNDGRYHAVIAAHITHMLRDTLEDTSAGYFNIPREYLQAHGISPAEVESRAYQEWVQGRVQLARMYFKAGRATIARVKNLRCRLAGYAYTARFEWMLRAIERDNYHLRAGYPERKSLLAGLWMVGRILAGFFTPACVQESVRSFSVQSLRIEEQ
jgi:phytoene/squalene synthetase